jgi:hypothetical protein
VSVARDKYLPSHGRNVPIPKHPTTIGGHLRRRRLQLSNFQAEAAPNLNVSTVTLSRWECETVVPTAAYHARIIEYLAFNLFNHVMSSTQKIAKARNHQALPF